MIVATEIPAVIPMAVGDASPPALLLPLMCARPNERPSSNFVLSGENVNDGVKKEDGVKGALTTTTREGVNTEEGEKLIDEVKISVGEKLTDEVNFDVLVKIFEGEKIDDEVNSDVLVNFSEGEKIEDEVKIFEGEKVIDEVKN